jgi:TonB-dependent starch-binding outer membrane protein SusC
MLKKNHPIKKKKPILIQVLRFFSMAAILQIALFLTSAATSFTITLSAKNETLEGVFKKIQRQTGWCFLYTQEALSRSKRLSVEFSNTPLEDALRTCFKDQPLTYTIVDNVIVVKEKKIETIRKLTK